MLQGRSPSADLAPPSSIPSNGNLVLPRVSSTCCTSSPVPGFNFCFSCFCPWRFRACLPRHSCGFIISPNCSIISASKEVDEVRTGEIQPHGTNEDEEKQTRE